MASSRWLRLAEFLLWVAVVSTGVVAVSAVVAFAVGDGLLTLKFVLFVVGFLLFGVGSVGIQPKSLRRQRAERAGEDPLESDGRRHPTLGSLSTDSDTEYGFEKRILQVPPLRDERLALDDRVSRDWKLFATSLVVLAVSLGMELWLGVSV